MTPVQIGMMDLAGGTAKIPLAFSLAIRELRTRYKRTTLGPLWITLAQALWIFGVAIVFSEVFRQDFSAYLYLLAAGMPVWTYMATTISEAPTTFVASRGVMEQFGVAWTMQVWKRVIVNAWVFAQHMLIWLAAFAIVRPPLDQSAWLALPGLLLLFGAGWGATLLLGVLGARYRDLQPALTVAVNFMFVLTPVFWDPNLLPNGRRAITHLNPFFHYLEIVRAPLLGRPVMQESWIFCGVCTAVLIVVGCIVFARARKTLFNWL